MQEFEVKFQEMDFRAKEAFKTLRTNIEFASVDTKVIGITSATPNEGKSSISFELAISFARTGKKVLLIDADLRKSVMKSRYKRGRIKYGLVNYLAGQRTFEEVLCMTDVPNFYMAFAGPVPPNPSELLGSTKFTKLINDMREEYDIIIIDTPPIGSVIDAAVVSKTCDGMVLVLASGVISYRFARKVKEQLERGGAKLLGVVLNKVDMSGSGYYGKYYGKYYGTYYGKYGEEKEE